MFNSDKQELTHNRFCKKIRLLAYLYLSARNVRSQRTFKWIFLKIVISYFRQNVSTQFNLVSYRIIIRVTSHEDLSANSAKLLLSVIIS